MRYFKWFEIQSIHVDGQHANMSAPYNVPYVTSEQVDRLMEAWTSRYFTFEYSVKDDDDVITTHVGESGRDDRVLI